MDAKQLLKLSSKEREKYLATLPPEELKKVQIEIHKAASDQLVKQMVAGLRALGEKK